MSTTPNATAHFTADGVPITDGLPVWDNNLRAGRISFADTLGIHSPAFNGWFSVLTTDGGRSLMNGERLAIRHPITRQLAADAVQARQR